MLVLSSFLLSSFWQAFDCPHCGFKNSEIKVGSSKVVLAEVAVEVEVAEVDQGG